MTIVNTDIEVTYELLKNGTVAQKKVIDTKTNAFGLYKFDPKTDGMLMMGDSCVTSGPNDTLCFRMTIRGALTMRKDCFCCPQSIMARRPWFF